MLSDSFNHESSIDKESLKYTTNRIEKDKEENKCINENYISDEDANLDDEIDNNSRN